MRITSRLDRARSTTSARIVVALIAVTAVPHASAQQRVRQQPQAAGFELTRGAIELDMLFWGGRPVVMAKVNGKGPYRFHVDTGTAAQILLDKDLAAELDLVGSGTIEALSPSGRITMQMSKSMDISLPGATMKGVSGPILPLAEMATRITPDATDGVVGIIGLPAFRNSTLQLDYPGKKLRVSSDPLDAESPDAVEFTMAGPMPRFQVELAGLKIGAMFDSGSPGQLMVHTDTLKKLALTGEPVAGSPVRGAGNVPIETVRAELNGPMKLGRHAVNNVLIAAGDVAPLRGGGRVNIGSGTMKDFVFTIDQRSKLLSIGRP